MVSLAVSGNNRSVRLRHALSWLCCLGNQQLVGTTQAVLFYVVLRYLMFHLFCLVGFGYVAGKLLLFKP
ncbi:MAG: hypothetical protein ABIP37_06175 [Methylotenera sp.]